MQQLARRTILGLALAAAVRASVLTAQAAPPLRPLPADSDVARQLDRYLSARTEMGAFSGAVLVAREGRIVFRRGYGFADVERRIPFTPETRHEAASLSKMFTAMAALKLRDDGRLRLDDSICRYLDDCPEAWRPVTVQQLMRHTSGIPDYEAKLGLGSARYLAFMTRPEASREIYEQARHLPLDFTPGTRFSYSNTGYVVLSRVIERAAVMPFDRFVTERILRPAGMTRSGVLGPVRPRGLAAGYTHGEWDWTRTLAGVPLVDAGLTRVPVLPLASPEGDAWLYTTADDLYRWSTAMDGSALVPPAEVAEVFTPGLEQYGYGWFVGQGFGRRRMRHNGQLPGYVSDFIRFPDEKITIVILSNLDRAPMVHIARDVSSIVLGVPYDAPVRGRVVALAADQAAALAGTYRMANGAILTIRRDTAGLAAELKDGWTSTLVPLSPTEFYFPVGDGRATFTLDATGRAAQVNIRYSGEDHVAMRTGP